MVGLFLTAGIVWVALGILFRFFKWGSKTILTLVGVFFVTLLGIYFCILPPEVAVQARSLEIKGIYGMKVDYQDILGVTLSNAIPPIAIRTNGFNFRNTLKGDFKLKGVGAAKLFVNRKTAPYICIATRQSYIIVNYQEKAKTIKMFGLIRKAWKKHVKA